MAVAFCRVPLSFKKVLQMKQLRNFMEDYMMIYIQSIHKGILTTNFDNDNVDKIKLSPKMQNINCKKI
jgi:hypothetical protein